LEALRPNLFDWLAGEHDNKGKAEKTLSSTYFGNLAWEKHVKAPQEIGILQS
tara:strand:+ start:153 stop:308 length:156 start_codon:yes stop_codon:yes gene_type:complete